MDKTEDKDLICPYGDQGCKWQEEVARLQRQVNELAELVSRDPLTGLYNLRHFQQILPNVLEGTRRRRHSSCLIMIDLDHFKDINDTWGHDIGNLTLKQAASILTQHVRMIDTVCRYGGDEFVVVLPDTRLRQAVKVAERIRQSCEETPIVFDEGELYFTASIGVEIYDFRKTPIPAEDFIKNADKLLYQAKDAGRNQVAHRDFAEVEVSTAVTRQERDALTGKLDDDAGT